MPTAVPIAPCARLKCPVPLVQLCVKSWRIEAGNLNAERRKGKRRGTPRIRYELMKCCT